jgi:hypothetical protein
MAARVVPLVIVAIWLQVVGVFLLGGGEAGFAIPLLIAGLGLLGWGAVLWRRGRPEG